MHDDPTGLATIHCPRCDAQLTAPIAPVPDARLIADDGWDAWSPQGTWTRADPTVPSQGSATAEHPIRVHPHDLRAAEVFAEGFGCCGYAPHKGPNLRCRCGAPVGVFVDECSCRIEVRLLARWRESPGRVDVTGLSSRLDRLARTAPAPRAVHPETVWDWQPGDVDARCQPQEFEFVIDHDPDGIVARFVADAVAHALAISPRELGHAIAMRRLPIGDGHLALSFGLRDEGNRVLSSLGLVRRGDDVEIIESRGARAYGWRVWDEWIERAWAEAVDRWMESPARP